jgi:hypothetical protein
MIRAKINIVLGEIKNPIKHENQLKEYEFDKATKKI